ncbi:uncharacterized protein LOC134833224 [Culicoides brevitarsis]|uniref:uncharacterized protein LOC134833224 n=1 Tax=Culicoides brevitarsis TaxID=469753 RepID=UPI00307C1772
MSKEIILVHFLTAILALLIFRVTNGQEFCSANQYIKCQSEVENQSNILLTWPTTQSGNIAFSKPFCLDNNMNSIIRTCCNGLWGQVAATGSTDCAFYAYDFSKKCPQNYTEVYLSRDKILCIMVSKYSAWDKKCLDSGTQTSYLDLKADEKVNVERYLRAKGITEAWLPAKRMSPFEPVVWKLPGWMWNKPIEFQDYVVDIEPGARIDMEQCLKLVLREGTNVSVALDDCSRLLPSLCVFDHLKSIIDTGNCISTRVKGPSQDKCYAISNIPDNITAIEDPVTINASEVFIANSVEKLLIYEQLAKRGGLNKDMRCLAHFMNGSQLYDNLGRWSVLDPTGKWERSPHFNCIATEVARKRQTPKLSLKFNPATGKLTLDIYSAENLWREDNRTAGIKCYTNADYELIKVIKVKRKIWSGVYRFQVGNTLKEVNKDIYDIKLYGDGPGYYWCEGHSIPDFTLVQTGKVYAARKVTGLTYAIALQVRLGVPLDIERDKKLLKNLAKEYRDHIRVTHELNTRDMRTLAHRITAVRPMKIESYDMLTLVTKFIFHVTVTTNLTEIELIEASFGPVTEGTVSLNSSTGNLDNEMPVHIREYYETKAKLHTLLLQANSFKWTYTSLNSTEYCLPTLDSPDEKYHWISAHIGERTLSKELCLRPNGLPLARKCLGDFIYGGTWDTIDFPNVECLSDVTDITKTLYEIDKLPISLASAHATMGAMSEMTENSSTVIPSDVYFLGKTIQTMSKLPDDTIGVVSIADTMSYYNNLAQILNNLMAVNETIVEKSASNLNATNILLDSFDNLINQFSDVVLLDNQGKQSEDGTMLLVTPRLMVFIAEPNVSGGISGVGIVRKNLSDPEPTTFDEYEIIKIHANSSVESLLATEGLELATFAPQELINRVDEMDFTGVDISADPELRTLAQKKPLRVVITIYFNDRLFVETGSEATNHQKSNTKVVSVSLPGRSTDLPVLFPTVFRQSEEEEVPNLKGKCGYWDFQSYEVDKQGKWSTEGCEYLGKSETDDRLIACGCTHLTHFAYLVMGTHFHSMDDIEEHRITEAKHAEALDFITFIGCSLSLIGILGIAVTAVAFKSWREKPGTKVLLHLSAAIALEMILIAYVNTEALSKRLVLENATLNCVILGAAMHYSILVVFSWMLITAFLQFMRYVKVLGETRPPRFLLKSSLIGWVIPLIPVLIIAFVDPMAYVPPTEALVPGICYPKGNALIFGLLVPIGLIVLGNLVVFIIVIYNIFRIPEVHIRTNERDLLVSQLRLSINLFFLLGLSWIFGLATVSKAGILFSYLFCLTATLQGFVLFIYFIIMDPMTRKFWQRVLANLGFNCVEKSKEFE